MATLSRRAVLALPAAAFPALTLATPGRAAQREYEVPFVGTPPPIVAAMLDLAAVTPEDLLIDLGSGDGRIAIAAGRRGARAIGIEIDPALVRRATFQASAEGLQDRVRFRRDDLYRAPIREASVVTLYLLPATNLRLRPRLLTELAPGTRIVAHAFGIGDWRPDEHRVVDGRDIYLWTVPAVAGGDWRVTLADARTGRLTLEQRFQDVTGTLDGAVVEGATLAGPRFAFTAGGRRYAGLVSERRIDGDGWSAEREDAAPFDPAAFSPAAPGPAPSS